MRHTIIVATLSSVAASVLTTAVISGSPFGADTASSANTAVEAEGAVSPGGVTSVLQGDINCDGVVDGRDALGDLRFVGGLSVQQDEPCPDVGTLAAIPGPAGPQGAQGPQGPAGPSGVSGLQVVLAVSGTGSPPNPPSAIAQCPQGKKVIGGGAKAIGDLIVFQIGLRNSAPTPDGTGWFAQGAEFEPTNDDWFIEAYAICANVAD